jgi:hypothetical protein
LFALQIKILNLNKDRISYLRFAREKAQAPKSPRAQAGQGRAGHNYILRIKTPLLIQSGGIELVFYNYTIQ